MPMIIPAATLALAAQLTIAVADAVPRLDLGSLCRAASQRGEFGLSLGLGRDAGPQQGYSGCVRSEMASRRRLVKLWPTFRPADRANCVGETNAGGFPSYTDLLTCLQMARDASKLGQ
jgi:hypothetical protein